MYYKNVIDLVNNIIEIYINNKQTQIKNGREI